MQTAKRPSGVWLLLVVYFGSVISTLRWFWRLYTERQPVLGPAAESIPDPGALSLFLVVTGLMLSLAFLVALFRMRRVAIAIFTAHIVVAAVSNGIFFNSYRHLFKGSTILDLLSPVVVVVVALAFVGLTYFYLRSLAREGQLT